MSALITTLYVRGTVKAVVTPTGLRSVTGFRVTEEPPGVLTLTEGTDTVYSGSFHVGFLHLFGSSELEVDVTALNLHRICVIAEDESTLKLCGTAECLGFIAHASGRARVEGPELVAIKRLEATANDRSCIRVRGTAGTSMCARSRGEAQLELS